MPVDVKLASVRWAAGLGMVFGLTGSTAAAGADNNVEWNGISHIAWQDRRPLCPVDREAFQVRFQAYRDDLTAARVIMEDGSFERIANARVVAQRGPYDIWAADLPASTTDRPSYIIELVDGTDTDYLNLTGVQDARPTVAAFTLDFGTLEHAPVGATPVTGGGVVFRVWAPNASSALVRGTFNNWGTGASMTRRGEFWVARVPQARVNDQYKYFFNNSLWKSDPRARRLVGTDGSYNSVVTDQFSYQWATPSFSPPATEDLVIYQLHVGSFAGRNDPAGSTPNPSRYIDVAARADHLAELGVNAVMINPINEFPGDFSGGYNPITMFGFESRYGTPDQLKQMVDALHARGIAVLLDIVWNHFSGSDNFLWNFDGTQVYFDSTPVGTPWGSQADFDRQQVRAYFLDSVVLMLEEFGLDGFRMDATGYMDVFPQDASGWSLMQQMNDLIDRRYADKTAIAEQLPDDSWVTRDTSRGGAGFDSQYHDRFTDTLREAVFGAAFGSPNMWSLRDIVNGSGEDLSGRDVVNYFELHDEAWPLSGGQRAVKTIDTTFPHDDVYARSRTTLAQAFTLLSPGVPAFLMGTEWLEDAGFEGERLDWSKKTRNAGVLSFYQELLALRVGNTAMRANSPHNVFHVNDGADVMAFERYNFDGLNYVVVANLSTTDWGDYRIGLPRAGTWGEVINSQSSRFGGSGFDNPAPIVAQAIARDGFAQSASIRIPAMGVLVLQHGVTPVCEPDINRDGTLNVFDIFAFFSAFGAGDTASDINDDGTLNVFDIFGFFALFGAGC